MRHLPPTGSRRAPSETRASDEERDETIALLRDHHGAGRLTDDEFEERTAEAYRARFHSELWHAVRELPVPRATGHVFVAPPAGAGTATVALVLAAFACLLLLFSVGVLFALYTPLGATAWLLGRRARLAAPPGVRGPATLAEILGIVTTLVGLMAFGGCALILT